MKEGEFVEPAIAWTPPPPTPAEPLIPILSPKPGAAVHAIVTSYELLGVTTHFLHRRTKPCLNDEARCEGCLSGLPKRWKGYLAAELPPGGHKVLIEITYDGYRTCKELQAPGVALHGRRIDLRRMGSSKQAKVKVELDTSNVAKLCGEPFDVKAALLRIWFGERPGRTDAKNKRFEATMDKLTHQFAPPSDD